MMTSSFNKAWEGFLAGCLAPSIGRDPPYVPMALADNPRPVTPYFYDVATAIQHATFMADKKAVADSANKGTRMILRFDGTGKISVSWDRPDLVRIVFEAIDFGDRWEPAKFAVDAVTVRVPNEERLFKAHSIVNTIVRAMEDATS